METVDHLRVCFYSEIRSMFTIIVEFHLKYICIEHRYSLFSVNNVQFCPLRSHLTFMPKNYTKKGIISVNIENSQALVDLLLNSIMSPAVGLRLKTVFHSNYYYYYHYLLNYTIFQFKTLIFNFFSNFYFLQILIQLLFLSLVFYSVNELIVFNNNLNLNLEINN